MTLPEVAPSLHEPRARFAPRQAAAKRTIESEIERVRLARTTMEDTSGRGKALKGIADATAGPFTFEQLGAEVSFAATSVTKPDLGAVLAFAQKHVR